MGKIINRIGETNIATNGMQMTIIKYNNYRDIDIQFEDGTIVKGRVYKNFKAGCIQHPLYKNHQRMKKCIDKRIGETNVSAQGHIMTIVAYRKFMDIDVQFEDGTFRTNVGYGDFKSGLISKFNRQDLSDIRINETSVSKNHGKMTIINYHSADNIDVRFDDGTIRYHVSYSSFKKGTVAKNKNVTKNEYHIRLGESRAMNDNNIATIVEYRTAVDIDVCFDDGTIRKSVTYSSFTEGSIRKQKKVKNDKNLVGETVLTKDGMIAKIIHYRNYRNITIQFEDGRVVTNKQYKIFYEKMYYPRSYGTLKIGKLAYHALDRWAFYVKCEKCGLSDIMTYEQMQNHVCCQES